jgi:L-seryl-tRNA(Ser) seleniumtransferase
MDAILQARLKRLPQVNSLLETASLQEMIAEYSHSLIKRLCQEVLESFRQEILAGSETVPDSIAIIEQIKSTLKVLLEPRLRRVINGTGILLHTGLGRAPLLDEAYSQAFQRARGFCNVELDLASGQRGDRQETLNDLLRILSGAPSSAVVNNNAAAVLLALNTLSYRKETIVSRGQLIEIGGSFRLPEVMRKSGAKLVEVGTTNRTYLRDYEEAITSRTGVVLLAHSSNYRVKGFVEEVQVEELADLCKRRGFPLIHDLGGGVIYDLKRWGLPPEPVVSQSVAAGSSVVTFSGDKILGGPQAGILVGETEILKRLRRNPLMRALRPDKLTLAFLEETLKLYLSPGKLMKNHPVLARLTEDPEAATQRANEVLALLKERGLPDNAKITIVATKAQLGSGALPLEEFPSAALALRVKGLSAGQLAARLRQGNPPVIGYVHKNDVYVDLKAVGEDELGELAEAMKKVMSYE